MINSNELGYVRFIKENKDLPYEEVVKPLLNDYKGMELDMEYHYYIFSNFLYKEFKNSNEIFNKLNSEDYIYGGNVYYLLKTDNEDDFGIKYINLKRFIEECCLDYFDGTLRLRYHTTDNGIYIDDISYQKQLNQM